jgi:hypothetical protein
LHGGELSLDSLTRAGYILALIGGIIIIILGILGLLGSAFMIFSPISFLGSFVFAIITILIGIICVVGSKYVGSLTWAIILLVLGIIAGGIGGILVVIGAILGLISKLMRST